MRHLRLRSAFCGLVLLCAILGCSDPYPGRHEISGKITVKGEAFKGECSIALEPLDQQDTRAGILFNDGEFTIPRENGLKTGNYLVRLTAGDGTTPAVMKEEEVAGPGGSTNIVSVDRIPPEFGINSSKTFEVKAGGKNRLEIDLPFLVEPKSKKKR
jgi:hypothetical protein